MRNPCVPLGLIAAFVCAPAVAAEPLVLAGHLIVDGVAADDVRDFTVVARDEDGVTVATVEASGIVVVAGDFAFALDDAFFDAAVAAFDGGLAVEVSVAGLDVVAAAAVGAVAAVAVTPTAALAVVADTATTLGALTSADLPTRAQLAAAGVSVNYDNVVGRPAGIDDGDQGNVDGVGSSLTLSGTTLDVAAGAVTSAVITDGTIGSAAIADGAVLSTNITALGLAQADFAPASLTGNNFQAASLTAGDINGSVVTVFNTVPGCGAVRLTTSSTCAKAAVCAVGGQRPNCTTGTCEVNATTTCATTRLGQLLFAP